MANNRRRKIKSDAIGRALLKEKGEKNANGSYKPKKVAAAGADFHEMPHMFQDAPSIAEFMTGDAKTMHLKSILERNALDEFLATSLSAQECFNKENAVRILVKQSDQQMRENDLNLSSLSTDPEYAGVESKRIVPIPRRPINYVSGRPELVVSPGELMAKEEEMFLKWRLSLAEIEEKEGRVMTPFERNLEFWRQLWRVLERSDLVFQILDCRNPLFFRSEDLENYIKEIHCSKTVVLLLNKSDLVPQHIRQLWAHYFKSVNLSCIFFSALDELKKQDDSLEEFKKQENSSSVKPELSHIHHSSSSTQKGSNDLDPLTLCSENDTQTQEKPDCSLDNKQVDQLVNHQIIKDVPIELNTLLSHSSQQCPIQSYQHPLSDYLWDISHDGKMVDGTELLDIMQHMRDIVFKLRQNSFHLCDKKEEELNTSTDQFDSSSTFKDKINKLINDDTTTMIIDPEIMKQEKMFIMEHRRDDLNHLFVIGLVGYPNVGKSSIINSVLGHKVVSVSRQPGKTKHFQTLPLPTIGITLCDCPGLVFPQIVSTKSHLVINNVSSIDHVKGSFTSPIQLICDQIPHQLIQYYKLNPQYLLIPVSQQMLIKNHKIYLTPQNKNSAETLSNKTVRLDARRFLTLLAESRRQHAGGKGGVLELFQTAKMILKDFTTGRLLHWSLPPGLKTSTVDAVALLSSQQVMPTHGSQSSGIVNDQTMSNVSQLIDQDLSDDDDLLTIVSQQADQQRRHRSTRKKNRFLTKKITKGQYIKTTSTTL